MNPASRPLLLIRADAGVAIGVGHVMRCLALAQAWQDAGGEAALAAVSLPDSLHARLRGEGVSVHRIAATVGDDADGAATLALARRLAAAWVAVDGYEFSSDYFRRLRTAGLRVLALDDMAHLPSYPVDVLLNQNLGAVPETYAPLVPPEATLLLGPRHSLLRREFRRAANSPARPLHEPRRVLVSFGGSDPDNHSSQVIRNLARHARYPLEVVVLAGAASPHVQWLRATAEAAPFRCEVRVDVPDVAAQMLWADAAITAGGSTVWELASLRVPALIGASSENQLAGLAGLDAVPFFQAMRVERLLAVDLAAALASLWANASALAAPCEIDAHGATRVVARLTREGGPASTAQSDLHAA